MAEPLKYWYNTAFFTDFTAAFSEAYPEFNSDGFLKAVHNNAWENLELKDRMHHVAKTLNDFLPGEFPEQLKLIVSATKFLKANQSKTYGLQCMCLPGFVEMYGLNHLKIACNAFETLTSYSSAEFAIRPFIKQNPKELYSILSTWADSKDEHIRRLASEGCRPRLPWAMALEDLKKDPNPILPILEKLKRDPSEYVRRSVANNLNDISKDHPKLLIKLVKKWMGQSPETDKLLKHASRTLLKAGNSEIMPLFGLGSIEKIKITDLSLGCKNLKFGNDLHFEFQLENTSDQAILIRLEYALFYQKANGSLSKKVYKISEKTYEAKSEHQIKRKQPFKPISTRKFHAGRHELALVINGKTLEAQPFELIIPA